MFRLPLDQKRSVPAACPQKNRKLQIGNQKITTFAATF